MSNLFKNSKPIVANKKNEYPLPTVRPRSTVEQEIKSGRMIEKPSTLGLEPRTRKDTKEVLKSPISFGLVETETEAITQQMLVAANPTRSGGALSNVKPHTEFDDEAEKIGEQLNRNGRVGRGLSLDSLPGWNVKPQPLRKPFTEDKDFDVVTAPKQVPRRLQGDNPTEGFPDVNPFVADHATIHGALTKEECEEVLTWKTNPNYVMEVGTIAGIIKDDKFTKQREEIEKSGALEAAGYKDMDDYDTKYRVCNIWYDKRASEKRIPEGSILNKILQGLMDFNNKNFKFDCGGILSGEWPTLFEYNVGGKYDWHIDVFHTESTPIPACRKLSMTVMISDESEFEGGKLEFQGSPLPEELKQGDICVFPSYLPHRITPVTKGQRNVIVGWIHGPSWR